MNEKQKKKKKNGLKDITNIMRLQSNVEETKKPPVHPDVVLNEFTKACHADDILSHLKAQERKHCIKSTCFEEHPFITPKMRSIVVDWLVDIHVKAKLHTETLFLSINLLDRYLMASRKMRRDELQLCGIAALLVASKYEELFAPELKYLEHITDMTYTKDLILEFEVKMLKQLKFSVTIASIHAFLLRFLEIDQVASNVTNLLASYYTQRALQEFTLMIHPPSLIASAAIYLARTASNQEPWTLNLQDATGYSTATVKDRAMQLALLFQKPTKLNAVHSKFNRRKYGKVSTIPLPEIL